MIQCIWFFVRCYWWWIIAWVFPWNPSQAFVQGVSRVVGYTYFWAEKWRVGRHRSRTFWWLSCNSLLFGGSLFPTLSLLRWIHRISPSRRNKNCCLPPSLLVLGKYIWATTQVLLSSSETGNFWSMTPVHYQPFWQVLKYRWRFALCWCTSDETCSRRGSTRHDSNYKGCSRVSLR